MTGRILVDDLETVKALAILGEGIAWLPDFLAADALQAFIQVALEIFAPKTSPKA